MARKRKGRPNRPRPTPLAPFILNVMLGEVRVQCGYVLIAADQLNSAIAQNVASYAAYGAANQQRREVLARADESPEAPMEWDLLDSLQEQMSAVQAQANEAANVAWFAIQNLLNAAACISRLLWGDGSHAAVTQRSPLRELLGAGAGSPLKDRQLRNQFEHVDEKIIQQFTAPEAHTIFIGRTLSDHPARPITSPVVPQYHHYDRVTGIVSFWHFSVALLPLVAEVQRIHPVASGKGFPYGPASS